VKPKASKNPESVVRKIKRKNRRKFNSEAVDSGQSYDATEIN